MKAIKLNHVAFVQKIEEHDDFKKYMLEYIKSQPAYRLTDNEDDITNTDWQDSENINREYVSKLFTILHPHLEKISSNLYAKTYSVSNLWFQQYDNNSKHQWHYHNKVNWSAIYYIELPSDSLKTQFFDPFEKNIVNITDLEEGDLIVFPANILHRSPENNTGKTKTIISFNLDFDKLTKIY